MEIARALRLTVLIAGLLATINTFAQETARDPAPPMPDLAALETDTWAYFEGTREEAEPRVSAFLEAANSQIADLGPQNQEAAQSVLNAVRDNFTALLNLVDGAEPASQELPAEAVSYTIDELLEFAAIAREAETTADEEQVEVSREQRVLDGATRRRDANFKAYVEAAAGDDRWLAGLRLIQARSAQAISERRLELLVDRRQRGVEYANETAARVLLIADRLEVTGDEGTIDRLREQVDADSAAVEEAQERVRAAQLDARGLDVDTAQGLSLIHI